MRLKGHLLKVNYKTDLLSTYEENITKLQSILIKYECINILLLFILFGEENIEIYLNGSEDYKLEINNKISITLLELKNYLELKNPKFFKLQEFMPNLKLLNVKYLIVWIYFVEINQEKLKLDDNKKFFYLIDWFQKENKNKQKVLLLLELLKKIKIYVKYKSNAKIKSQ